MSRQWFQVAYDILMGEPVISSNSGHGEQPSETLLAKELLHGDAHKRELILCGCKDAIRDLLDWMSEATKDTPLGEFEFWSKVSFRICSVLDIATPKELSDQAKCLLMLSMHNGVLNEKFSYMAVRANRGYLTDPVWLPFWKGLLRHENLRPLALRMLKE